MDVIGIGGMAVVYKAYCHRLHRFVAIKILKQDLAADAEFRRRFHEEAQAVAMLSHANIVSVYDISRGDDLNYIVMELIDGITLKQYVQKKNSPLHWREALYFITQIVRALGHAHSRGIIHRDIKPQNIMVLRDGSVKVTDFGIARIMSAAQTTVTQEAIGSVHYISPEQARGGHIDARADLYSAGVVLYELLTGQLPYEGETPVSVALQHINATPRSPRELNPDIPIGLEEITMKAMASKVENRYAGAEAMLRDLEDFRKNPQTVFHYGAVTVRSSLSAPDEPTQPLERPVGGQRRQQRPASRPSPAPAPAAPPPPPPRRPREEPPEVYEEEEDEEPEQEKKHSRRTVVIPIVIIVGLLAAGLTLYLFLFSGLLEKDPSIQVPRLVGQNISDVYTDESITGHFKIVQEAAEYDDRFEEGEIIDQSPAYGQEVKENTTITVVVNGVREYVEMINVLEIPFETAVKQIESMGLTVGTPEYKDSDTVREGDVISSNPVEGAKMLPGDEVKLVVSTGPKIILVTVPDVRGQDVENARQMLEGAGLNVASVTEIDSDYPAGEVIYQSVSPRKEVEEGTSVALSISKGPVQVQEPEPPAQEPAPEVVTPNSKSIDVTLPSDRETVAVQVTVGGEVQYDTVVDTSVETIYPTLEGNGVQEIGVYFDGVLTMQEELDFDS